MRLRLASLTLWIFVIGTAFILGAGVYEALVVVPFWAGSQVRLWKAIRFCAYRSAPAKSSGRS